MARVVRRRAGTSHATASSRCDARRRSAHRTPPGDHRFGTCTPARIAQAARQVFGREGYARAEVDAIAAEAGVSTSPRALRAGPLDPRGGAPAARRRTCG
ncbi:TetR family transcriptional regulator [Streptomyces sp. NPDC059649]|uniref:TetR family transcriptional regulator n=1 Tax=Streptomyces sp. NPDC059649 TaxID=3346895 RepID=UPI00367C3E70